MDPRDQYSGEYCRGDLRLSTNRSRFRRTCVRHGNGKVEGPLCLHIRCLLFEFFSRCSVLVDSHACDETPWQEPREDHRRATPACLELLVNNPRRAGNDNMRRYGNANRVDTYRHLRWTQGYHRSKSWSSAITWLRLDGVH